MSGEQFAIVLCAGLAAFYICLIVQIVNRDRWAVWIFLSLTGLLTAILAILAFVVWQGAGV
jgi:zinc transporter ZupT